MKLPVLLVPGWRDRARKLRHLQQHLHTAGWSTDAVRAMEFRNRFGGNVEHADELAEQVREFMRNESVSAIDVVAHSMGGLAVRYLLQALPEGEFIRRAIFLGTPHGGTLAAWLALGQGARDMRSGSPFLRSLAHDAPGNAELISIRTPLDTRIFPGASANLAGARNLTIWCAGHKRLLRARQVLSLVQSLLEA